jgi:hypothetical protein
MSIPSDKVDLLVKLALTQTAIEAEIKELEERTTAKNKELDQIRGGYQVDGAIPKLMQEIGLEKLKLENGMEVTVKEELKPPSMAADAPKREAVLDWADKSGNGDVIKDTITIPFAKGDNRAKDVVKFLEEMRLDFDRFQTINYQTLKKLLNDMREEGADIPLEELEVRIYKQAKVK